MCLFSKVFSAKTAAIRGFHPGHDWPPYCVMRATKESVMRDKSTVRTLRAVGTLLPLALLAGSCSDDNSSALPPDVQAIVFLQRTPRGDQGNVFDYTSYAPGGKLVRLQPPGANGKL